MSVKIRILSNEFIDIITKPFVSVIIPVYNHQEFIGQAIESVLRQTVHNYEIIVINDGSTDNSGAIAMSYHPRIRYTYKRHGGTSSALNLGIKKAKGNLICWLSSDDEFLPTKLEKQIELFRNNPKLGLVYTDFYQLNENGKKKYVKALPPTTQRKTAIRLLKTNYINGSSVMIKAECLKHVGFFKENYNQAHDRDMWLRICRLYKFGYIPEPLIIYKRHYKNLSLHKDPLWYVHKQEMFWEAQQFFNFKPNELL